MAYIIADRIRAISTTTGTGALTLGSSPSGYSSFGSVMADSDTCPYIIVGRTTTEWEVGIGTYTASGTTLTRTTIIASSNSGAVVTLSGGTKDVSIGPCALLSGKVVSKGSAGATPTPNCLDGQVQMWDYTANATWGAPTNALYPGYEITLVMTQASAGSYTTAWNATYHGAPAITAGATNTKACARFIYNGAHWDWVGGSTAFA